MGGAALLFIAEGVLFLDRSEFSLRWIQYCTNYLHVGMQVADLVKESYMTTAVEKIREGEAEKK
jgi:hypothetical protein